MRCLHVICLIMSLCNPLYAEELHLLTDTSEIWRARDTPQHPATDLEKLALQAAVAGTTVTKDRVTAYYIVRKNSFDLVRVEEAPESTTEDLYSVSSYQIRDGKIWGDTRLKYVVKPNPENEQVAREIALDYLLGRIGQIPVIFNGWVYVVDYDGKCIITVTAKDETTEHFTYRYSSCR